MADLHFAAEIALETPAEPPEPTDAELLQEFRWSMAVPGTMVHSPWGLLPAEQVRSREKQEFLARRRRELALAKEKRIQAQQVAEERAAEQARFELAASKHEARVALGAALTVFQQALAAGVERVRG
jgi:hypothetical protein